MPNKKNPRHILPTLICLVLVLGLNGACRRGAEGKLFFLLFFESSTVLVWVTGDVTEGNIWQTDTNGENGETLPTAEETKNVAAIPGADREPGENSPLRVGLTAAGANASAEPAVDVAVEEPRLILAGRTTAQILNLGTNTLGAQVDLPGTSTRRVAVSGDGAFAAVVVTLSDGGGFPQGVHLIDLSIMTLTGTIELPLDCSENGIAFIPGTNDFAVACEGEGAIRFYSLNGGAGSGLIREFTGCEGARALVFTADGQRGLFSCTSSVWVYDVLSESVVHTIEGFDLVLSMATTMDATRAYITNTRDDGGELIVVDLATYDIVRTTEVGDFPATVVVGPDDQRVYVLGTRDGVRGLDVIDKQGVVLNFVPPPAFPITFLVVRAPNPA